MLARRLRRRLKLVGACEQYGNRAKGYGIVRKCRIVISFDRAGALVQWLKLPAWKVEDRDFEPDSGLQVSKKQFFSFSFTREDSIL